MDRFQNFNHTEGAQRGRGPGVHNRRLRVMDSELATWRWRPEMTAEALWDAIAVRRACRQGLMYKNVAE